MHRAHTVTPRPNFTADVVSNIRYDSGWNNVGQNVLEGRGRGDRAKSARARAPNVFQVRKAVGTRTLGTGALCDVMFIVETTQPKEARKARPQAHTL